MQSLKVSLVNIDGSKDLRLHHEQGKLSITTDLLSLTPPAWQSRLRALSHAHTPANHFFTPCDHTATKKMAIGESIAWTIEFPLYSFLREWRWPSPSISQERICGVTANLSRMIWWCKDLCARNVRASPPCYYAANTGLWCRFLHNSIQFLLLEQQQKMVVLAWP